MCGRSVCCILGWGLKFGDHESKDFLSSRTIDGNIGKELSDVCGVDSHEH
jgi:hypothetical protein